MFEQLQSITKIAKELDEQLKTKFFHEVCLNIYNVPPTHREDIKDYFRKKGFLVYAEARPKDCITTLDLATNE